MIQFFDHLIRYETDLWNHLDAQLAAVGGPTLAVLSALRAVRRHPGAARVAELQDDLRITVGAASKFADRLEHEGLITRRPNPTDRRSSLLELTALGESRHDEGMRILESRIAEHLEGFEAEAALAGRIFRALTDRLALEPVR